MTNLKTKIQIPSISQTASHVIIGDVHGKYYAYWEILKNCGNKYNTIQVGDFGFKEEQEWHLKNVNNARHKINFGNHDDYTYLNHAHSLKNYSFANGIFTVRGAFSTDRWKRDEGVDWFANEELTYGEMIDALNVYCDIKPEIMVTHDCPHEVREHLFNIKDKSTTSNGLQAMFEIHQPRLWIFGHHHVSKNEVINGTRFICLSELETLAI